MKFKLHNFKFLYGRLGCISDVERLPSFKLETPNILFYTKRGCVPHLTYDVLQLLTKKNLPIQINLRSIIDLGSIIEESKEGINSFIGMPEFLSYVVIQDPLHPINVSKLLSDGVAVSSRYERRRICKEVFMDIMEIFRPDMYVLHSDGCTNLKSGVRRISNSYNTTMNSVQYCIERHFSSKVLKNKGLIASIVGGGNKDLREECSKTMSSYPVSGYLIDGMYLDSEMVSQIPQESIEEVLSYILPHLPDNRFRIIHGPWDPKMVLKMIKLGVDLFDTSFPVAAAENGFALTFDFEVGNLFDNDVLLGEVPHISHEIVEDETELRKDDSRLILEYEFKARNFKKELSSNPYVTNLHDARFVENFTPIFPGCDCLCCRKYTKSYIYHLLACKELQGFVLLSIHNIHHYLHFFKKIRETIQLLNQARNEVSAL